jgi:hypothetical protein
MVAKPEPGRIVDSTGDLVSEKKDTWKARVDIRLFYGNIADNKHNGDYGNKVFYHGSFYSGEISLLDPLFKTN